MVDRLKDNTAGSIGLLAVNSASLTSRAVYLIIAIIAVSPLITALITWDLDGQLTQISYAIRRFWLITVIAEMLFVGVAVWIKVNAMRIGGISSHLKPSKTHIFATILISGLLISAIYNGGVLNFMQAIFWCFHVTVFWAGCTIIAHSGSNMLDRFWILLSAGAVIYSLLFILFFVLVPNPATYPWNLRPAGFTNIRHIGYFVGPAVIVSIGILARFRKIPLLAVSFVLFCELTLLLWTGTRGAIFALVVSLFLGMLLFPQLRQRRVITAVFLTGLAAGLFSLTLPTPTASFGVIQRMSGYYAAGEIVSDAGRIEVWKQTISAIAERPIFGHGPAGFRPVISKELGLFLNHPHNVFLQFAFSWGIPLAILMSSMFISKIWESSQSISMQKDEAVMPATILIHIIIYSIYDGVAFYALPVFISMIALVQLTGLQENFSGRVKNENAF